MKGKGTGTGRGRARASGPVTVAGVYAGALLGGVTCSVIETDGVTVSAFGPTTHHAYDAETRSLIRAAMGLWPGTPGVDMAAQGAEAAHLAVLQTLGAMDLVGVHGQTLAHDIGRARTHQVGVDAALARRAGRKIVWDFRSSDMALGGQGTPLTPFYHWALARFIGSDAAIAFLNLGAVGTISWVDPRAATPDLPGACIAFDTGPANTALNALVQSRRGKAIDRDGRLSRHGAVDGGKVAAFLDDVWFRRIPPKALAPDDFARLPDSVAGLDDQDAVATLAACVAGAVAQGMEHLPSRPSRILVTGGGRHNAGLMEMLATALDRPVEPAEAAGLDGDAVEAQAIAYLAVRVLRGLPTTAPGTTGVAAPVGGGRVSVPEDPP